MPWRGVPLRACRFAVSSLRSECMTDFQGKQDLVQNHDICNVLSSERCLSFQLDQLWNGNQTLFPIGDLGQASLPIQQA